MIEPVLHLLKIHREVIFGNAAIVVQNMLRKTPKSFYAVDVILALIGKRFAVVQTMVFSEPLQRVVASEGVRVIDRSFSRFLSDNCHEFFFGHMLHHPRIYLAVPFQKAKHNVFAGCTPTTLALASAAEVALVHLHLAVQSAALKLRHMVDCLSKFLVDTGNRLVVSTEVMREAVRRLLLVESLQDGNFCSDSLQRFLFSTGLAPTPNISSTRLRYLERTAEYALLSSQKVGCATENVLSPLCHMDILLPYGYETP